MSSLKAEVVCPAVYKHRAEKPFTDLNYSPFYMEVESGHSVFSKIKASAHHQRRSLRTELNEPWAFSEPENIKHIQMQVGS